MDVAGGGALGKRLLPMRLPSRMSSSTAGCRSSRSLASKDQEYDIRDTQFG